MITFEVVNAPTSLDISQANKVFFFMNLNLPIILVKISTLYLPYQLGSQLLGKVGSTSSNCFNMKVQ